MGYSKSCLIVLVFAALLLLSSRSSARELADQTQQSVQPGGVEDDLHKGHKHKHHHHHKHEHKHHKKPGHGGASEDGKENTESKMEDDEN